MNYDALVILAALVSVQMAQGLTDDQLELIATFFEVLGNNLALLALRQSSEDNNTCSTPKKD